MAKLYERYLIVLKSWPLNPELAIPLRSLPEYIRSQGKAIFSARGELTGGVDVQKCDRRLKSLETLTRNHWCTVYPHTRLSGSLGLTKDQCKYGLSEEYIEACKKPKPFQGILNFFQITKEDKKA